MIYTLQSLLAEFDKEFDLYLDEGERYEVKSFITTKITKLVTEAVGEMEDYKPDYEEIDEIVADNE